ncbi:G domain-containing protein [Mycena venus]|uniref:G domain-containing protein n=1 Tax=Mycena venus TaxID=2733690 RepID=A0A8H6XRM2_9AGAR|nr:G domain-containing protein [Mycena venus]
MFAYTPLEHMTFLRHTRQPKIESPVLALALDSHPPPLARLVITMAPETLPPLTKEILAKCPRLRVLVAGKSGVGKSSLISYAFGVDRESTSVAHGQRGKCDINDEIVSEQNSRLVLHDSIGYEPGHKENFKIVSTFLKSRSGNHIALPDRVHVIWLCIKVPHAAGRVFETGDEDLLKLASEMTVPIIVVFTQFDKLFNSVDHNLPEDTPKETVDELCDKEFEELCVKPLRNIGSELHYARSSGLSGKKKAKPDREALEHLVKLTRDLVEADVQDSWLVTTMAQRASAQVKIKDSINVGMKRYWTGLPSNTMFSGSKLDDCLATVHEELTDTWNFHDPKSLLLGDEFRTNIRSLAVGVTQSDAEAESLIGNITNQKTVQFVQSWAGLAGAAVTAVIDPVIATIPVIGWFVTFTAKVYTDNPKTLRCLMGYIIDLTLVLDKLFVEVLPVGPRPLTETDVEEALKKYKTSNMWAVHRDIRQYTREVTVLDTVVSTAPEKVMEKLILKYSSFRQSGVNTP